MTAVGGRTPSRSAAVFASPGPPDSAGACGYPLMAVQLLLLLHAVQASLGSGGATAAALAQQSSSYKLTLAGL